jgi:nucleotide-binding universal stress UspA family protein
MPSSVPQFQRVLCAVDFSEHSRTALRYAAAITRRSQGHLTVLFVNDPLLVAAAAAAYDTRALASTTRRQLQQFVQGAVGTAADVHCAVALGEPAREIHKAAARTRAHLIVLGTRGLGDARKLFVGSTAGRVLRTTKSPVLAIPPVGRSDRYPSPEWPRQVVAAIELGSRVGDDARRAVNVARWFRARAVLATVIPPAQTPPWLHVNTGDRDRVGRARKALLRVAASIGGDAVPVRVLLGDPAEQIAAAAADAAARVRGPWHTACSVMRRCRSWHFRIVRGRRPADTKNERGALR